MNIRDIAKICGVSPSTVSKILHNKDKDISIETRKRVLEVIKEYQYVPYSKVIKSVSPKTNIIGVVLSSDAYGVQDMLYSIEKTASDNGYSIMVCNTEGDRDRTVKCMKVIENKGVDGIIAIYQDEDIIGSTAVPAVCVFDHKVPAQQRKTADIYYEMRDVGYLATSFLIKNGHYEIGALLLENDAEIEEGYYRAYKENFLSPRKEWIIRGNEEDIISIGVHKCLNNDITAILCADAIIGNVVYDRLRERGDMGRISVISARDSTLADKMNPKLSAVSISPSEIGKTAVESLLHIIEGKKPVYESRKKIEAKVIDRESVDTPISNKQGGKLVVVGSMNMDCMINVSNIPTDGETLRSRNIVMLPGGKGANQAVGAGKLGGKVYMIGRLGNDSDGKEIYNSLVNSGVKTDGVVFDDSIPTGKAYINVAADGKSTIVIYSGANEKLDNGQVKQFEHLLDDARYCLLNLEISEQTVAYTINKCKKKNVEVILKPSSVEKISESLLKNIDYFIPNEKELKQLIPDDMTIEEKAEALIKKGVKNVIITLGEKGCYLRNEKYSKYFPAADFHPVDTTGAADAFISALAVCLSEGNDIIYAICFATYAAGISITRQGVQPAMVDRVGLDIYREEINALYANSLQQRC
ncbi:MAG: substrate-binding domain-containing protein [Clostridiales bacterium]|nr:substrate-binding domain-containing protein [Clostridiales bacterium]